jgi:hypothetical protein
LGLPLRIRFIFPMMNVAETELKENEVTEKPYGIHMES